MGAWLITTVSGLVSSQTRDYHDGMAFGLHITRAEHWTDSGRAPITIDELRALAAVEAGLTVLEGGEEMVGINPATRATIRVPASGPVVVWESEELGEVHFQYRDGRLTLHCRALPPPVLKAKLASIASRLGARIIGDEGKPYA